MINAMDYQKGSLVEASLDQVSAEVQWSATYDEAGNLLNGLGGDTKWRDVQRPDYNNLVGQGPDRVYGQVFGIVALDTSQVSQIVSVIQAGNPIHAIGLDNVRMGWNFNSPCFLDLAFYNIGHAGIPLENVPPMSTSLLDIRRPSGAASGISPVDAPQPLFDIFTGIAAQRVADVLGVQPWDACGLAADYFVRNDAYDEWGAIEKPEPGTSRLVMVYET